MRRRRLRVGLAAAILVALFAAAFFALKPDDATAPVPPPADDQHAPVTPTEAPPPPTEAPLPADVTVRGCVPAAPTGTFAAGTFRDTFDGDPARPEPWCPSDWDVFVHSRDVERWEVLEPVAAQHGPGCEGPPATHTLTGYDEAVHRCRSHVMTALNASGYGVIYLTPAALVDFSGGEAVISWEMSTLTLSQRDFVDLWVTPYDENLVLPLDDYLPDGQGEPRHAVQVRMDASKDGPIFRVRIVRGFEAVDVEGNWWTSYTSVLTPDAARRDRFELRLSQTHVRFGMPDYGLWWVDAPIPALNWSEGIVQFGHHSYNPFKDGNGGPNTWHWDNVTIAPARPFRMVAARERYVSDDGGEITFGSPAPADAHLRFAAAGSVELSFDGGRTWQRALRQVQERDDAGHFASYWMPIPEGTSSVLVRGGPDRWFRHWAARNFAIWARTGGS